MQALENTARLSWVKTYPVWPNVRKDERNRRIQVLNVGLDLYSLSFLGQLLHFVPRKLASLNAMAKVYVFYARADNNKTGDYVTYTDCSPDVIASASPQVILQRAEKSFVAGKTMLSEQAIDLDGVPGRAYTATDSDGNFYTAHKFLVGTRIYQVLVLTTKSNFPSGQDNGQFLNSFIILGNPPRP